MIRAAAIPALVGTALMGTILTGLLAPLPADAQGIRGGVAYATFSMACYPTSSRQPGNIIILATGAQVVPAGTAVTVTYQEPLSTVSWLGGNVVSGWVQKTIVYRTKHTMHNSDPEGVGVTRLCVSAHYTSNKAVLGR